MAQATAPILNSTIRDIARSQIDFRFCNRKRFHGHLYRRRTFTDPSPLLPHASPPAQPDY